MICHKCYTHGQTKKNGADESKFAKTMEKATWRVVVANIGQQHTPAHQPAAPLTLLATPHAGTKVDALQSSACHTYTSAYVHNNNNNNNNTKSFISSQWTYTYIHTYIFQVIKI